jgi:hypothetical protein
VNATHLRTTIAALAEQVESLRAENAKLLEALKFYASEGTYNITCAMHDGVPSEVPHLVIEEDGGTLARRVLAALAQPAQEKHDGI